MKKIYIFLLGLICSFSVFSAESKYHFMLTGASFAVPENG